MNSENEFARTERLGKIIFRAKLQTFDPALGLTFGTEKEERNRLRACIGLEFLGNLKPIEFRQHDIENDGVRPLRECQRHPLGAVTCTENLKFGLLQMVTDQVGDILLVLDQQNRFRHGFCGIFEAEKVLIGVPCSHEEHLASSLELSEARR